MSMEHEIYSYLNQRNINHTLSDDDFETKLPELVDQIYEYGFGELLKDQIANMKSDTYDWANLCQKNIDVNHISAQSTVGLNIIKRNMTHLYDVKNYKGMSISNLWSKEILEKVLRINRKTHSSTYISEIIRQIGFVAGTSKVTIYRPLLTKRIVEFFGATNILDPCIGWGGRMLGSVCVPGVKYTGFEPCVKTYEGLCRIRDSLSLVDNTTIYNLPAEVGLESLHQEYDMILTSPPYYNLEIYSDENTQSHNYGSYEAWVDKFLRPVITMAISKLVSGGKSCWSVKNFKTDRNYNLYDDVKRIHADLGWVECGPEFYVGNSVRAGIKDSDGNPVKGKEITFVFSKEE